MNTVMYRICWRCGDDLMAVCCPTGRRFADIDLAIAAAREVEGRPGHTRFTHGVAAIGEDGSAFVVATCYQGLLGLGEPVVWIEREKEVRQGA